MWRKSVTRRIVSLIFLTGAVLGASATASGLWVASGLFEPVPASSRRVALFVVVGSLAILRARGAFKWLPQAERQVPPSVFYQDTRAAALAFGFELGTGVRTYVSSLGPYVIGFSVLLLRPDFATAMLVGFGFGIGRWGTLLLMPRALELKGKPPATVRIRVASGLMSGACVVAIFGLALS